MSTPHRFRRPASLSPTLAEQVTGDPRLDPGEHNNIAHDSAAALLRDAQERPEPAVIERIVNLAQTEGLDDLADLWARCPAVSLPGAMWRLFLVQTFVKNDPFGVSEKFAAGRALAPVLDVLAGVELPPGPQELSDTINQIMRGAFSGDFAVALERSAALCLLVAFGGSRLASAEITVDFLDRDPALTAHGERINLIRLAESLQESARQWRLGHLN